MRFDIFLLFLDGVIPAPWGLAHRAYKEMQNNTHAKEKVLWLLLLGRAEMKKSRGPDFDAGPSSDQDLRLEERVSVSSHKDTTRGNK